MISVHEALKEIVSAVSPLETEECPLEDALGRTLAEAIAAPFPLPPFDNSAMDGYAIHAGDVTAANPEAPVWLHVIGEIPAGSVFEKTIRSGETVKIMTGAPVPEAVDAVVKLEEARIRNGRVEIRQPIPAGKHIRRKGEDILAGEKVLAAGTTVQLQHLGLLAALGRGTVRVYRIPSVSVLTTGSELVETGRALSPGKIHNSNRLVLAKLFEKEKIPVRDVGTVADDPTALKRRVKEASSSGLLIISGGVSVGKYDYVKEVLQELGMKTIFWRVNMKPGQPVLFGRLNHQWVFGLPGNPISCVACFFLFVRTAVQKMRGVQNPRLPIVHAVLQKKVTKQDERRHYLTALLRESNGQLIVTPTGKQGSGMLAALSEANAFIVVPEEKNILEEGELVDVLSFCHFCLGAVE